LSGLFREVLRGGLAKRFKLIGPPVTTPSLGIEHSFVCSDGIISPILSRVEDAEGFTSECNAAIWIESVNFETKYSVFGHGW
jgi:hypothetical protein